MIETRGHWVWKERLKWAKISQQKSTKLYPASVLFITSLPPIHPIPGELMEGNHMQLILGSSLHTAVAVAARTTERIKTVNISIRHRHTRSCRQMCVRVRTHACVCVKNMIHTNSYFQQGMVTLWAEQQRRDKSEMIGKLLQLVGKKWLYKLLR